MNIISKSLHGRITQQGYDKLGRWTFISLATKRANMIYVITAYKLCKTNLQNAGPMTVFHQQWTPLQGIQDPNPREQFDKELLKFLTNIQEKGHQIILLGDFNETPDETSTAEYLIQQHRLMDPWNPMQEESKEFNTYFRGHDRLDRCLISTSLQTALHDIKYIDFNMIGGSDHRGILVDFNKSLLQVPRTDINTMSNREIRSNDRKQAVQYIEKFYQHCLENNAFDKMKALRNTR